MGRGVEISAISADIWNFEMTQISQISFKSDRLHVIGRVEVSAFERTHSHNLTPHGQKQFAILCGSCENRGWSNVLKLTFATLAL